jgi:hypothetical protein
MRWDFQQMQTSGEKIMQLRAVVCAVRCRCRARSEKIQTRSGGGGGSEAIKLILLN